MGSVNKVILMGNLGRDPEVRYTQGGQAVANFTIATNDAWTDKQGAKQEKVEWHRVVLFGRQAEIAGEHLKKGKPVYIEGRLQTREWTDKENKRQFTTEIVGDKLVFVGGGGDSNSGGQRDTGGSRGNRVGNGRPQQEAFDDAPMSGGRGGGPDDGDIPFVHDPYVVRVFTE